MTTEPAETRIWPGLDADSSVSWPQWQTKKQSFSLPICRHAEGPLPPLPSKKPWSAGANLLIRKYENRPVNPKVLAPAVKTNLPMPRVLITKTKPTKYMYLELISDGVPTPLGSATSQSPTAHQASQGTSSGSRAAEAIHLVQTVPRTGSHR